MQGTFLGHLADKIITDHGENLSKVTVVLPSKRSGLFLHRELVDRIGKATWLPEVQGFDDLVLSLTDKTQPDPIVLACEFYLAYLSGKSDESFEKAYNWIPTAISDFNDIDLALADTKSLFKNISASKKLEEWNPDGTVPTDNQKEYLKFWEALESYYHLFNERLAEQSFAYRGMYYREASEKLQQGIWTERTQYETIIFAGLNALTNAEQSIITSLQRLTNTEVYWDIDKHLMDQPDHEASRFITKNIDALGNGFAEAFENLIQPKEVHSIASMGKVGQAKVCADILSDLQGDLDNTAVIVGDERTLDPLLSSVSSNLDRFNTTLGYPLPIILFQVLRKPM